MLNVSTQNDCNNAEMLYVLIKSRMYEVVKNLAEVVRFQAGGRRFKSYVLQDVEFPGYTSFQQIRRVTFQSFDRNVFLCSAGIMSIEDECPS
jgi:hypothetical protein